MFSFEITILFDCFNGKMQKFILIILIISLFSFSGFTQTSGDSINQKVGNKKVGKWVVFGKDQRDARFSSNQIVQSGNYVNGRKDGLWIKYYANGNKKSEIVYKRGRPNGKFKLFYPNGNVEEEGEWTNRVYNGSFKRYYENGTLEQEKEFDDNGKAKGKVVYYFPNGKKELEFTTSNGKETGKAVRYYPNGDVKEVISFEDGEAVEIEDKKMVNTPVKVGTGIKIKQKSSPQAQGEVNNAQGEVRDGYAKRFNKNNDILMDGEFKKGKLYTGKWYKYDENGLLDKIEVYKKGKYVGDGVIGM